MNDEARRASGLVQTATRTVAPAGDGERLINARQLGDMLGISAATVLDWWEAGRLPGFRLNGRTVRFRPSEVAVWLEEQRGKAKP